MNNSELSHAWYHQTRSEGNGSNYFYRGATVYSYGTHFPVACHVANSKGEHAVLLTSRGYSVTTQRHISLTHNAIPSDATVFRVALTSRNAGATDGVTLAGYLEDYRARIEESLATLARTRKSNIREYRLELLARVVAEANRFIEFWNLRVKAFTLPDSFELCTAELTRIRAKKAKLARLAAKRLERENADVIRRWLAGDTTARIPYSVTTAYLRVVGDTVQTSLGAEFPVSHAVNGLRFVQSVMSRGTEYRRTGHTFHLGVHAIDSVSVDGTVVAGCHTVLWSEIQRIEPQLLAYMPHYWEVVSDNEVTPEVL